MNIQIWLLSMEYKSYRISGWSVIRIRAFAKPDSKPGLQNMRI